MDKALSAADTPMLALVLHLAEGCVCLDIDVQASLHIEDIVHVGSTIKKQALQVPV